jgi:hypothetical protein
MASKKSVIQILILVVLLAGGAGAYLMSQGSGLDLSFITDLLPGDDPKPAPVATAPVPTPKKAEAPAAAIPTTPAKGQVAGNVFEPDSVVIEGGVLAFVQSKEPQTAVLIRLTGPRWETPSGKKFKYAPAAGDAPVVVVNRMVQGEMKQQSFTDKYTLTLEFGSEKDRKLPGKLLLDVPGDPRSTIGGVFDADVKGFRFVEGKPDLAADSTDTLQYLALREVLKDDPDKQIDVVAFRDGRYAADAAPTSNTGYIEIEYRVGQSSAEIKRFQFVKDPDWKVRGTLALDQIDEAHPVAAPGAKEAPAQLLSYLAAKRLEADVKKKSPKKGIYGVSFVTRHSPKTKIGVSEASYQTEPGGQTLKTAYLFRLGPKGWALDRELTAKEKVNVDTGKIEKR